ncbi:hypothetical protein HN858_01150 [Candidatus Falkowbacteria bacterium]|nr:hypothetical protein [Candidatus Falkowbacteria bacterium]MBT6574317.1 hypothetical protein [Candidatus Falkowbacteria bacterium]MBT7348262.1 hypothetical protein [Candidatus Falkowbacteria bacterium]MBT7500241.1 hypothetical protein [Candidatus Falkowbacteria bacterium]
MFKFNAEQPRTETEFPAKELAGVLGNLTAEEQELAKALFTGSSNFLMDNIE